jgi:thiol-disulfide isomerase/thioredoxin
MRVRPVLLRTMAGSLLAVLALLPAGCGRADAVLTRGVSANQSGGPSPAVSVPAGPVVTPASLKFTGTTLDGKAFDAASLAGRPVILWFWAPWCATCFGQGPTVAKLADMYRGRVSIVGVPGLDQSTAAMKDFVKQAEVGNVPQLNDRTGAVWKKFGIKEQSTFAMINRSGEVMQTGFQDSVTLTQWAAYLDGH